MSKTTEVLRGIVHGKSIELEHPLPMPDGSQIELIVKRTPISTEQRQQRRCNGIGVPIHWAVLA